MAPDNDLEATRPVVLCDPENGWNEIITPASSSVRGPLARRWEMVLRKELFWAEQMQDDKVIEPFFEIGYTHTEDDWGVAGLTTRGGAGGAYVWEPALHGRGRTSRSCTPPRFAGRSGDDCRTVAWPARSSATSCRSA